MSEVESEAVFVFGGDDGDGVPLELALGAEAEVPFDSREGVELVWLPELAVVVG